MITADILPLRISSQLEGYWISVITLFQKSDLLASANNPRALFQESGLLAIVNNSLLC